MSYLKKNALNMFNILKLTIFITIIFNSVNLLSLDKNYVKSVFENDSKSRLLDFADVAFQEGRIDDLIDITFQLWLTERSFFPYLLEIAMWYSDNGDAEMSGIFLVEAARRTSKRVDIDGLKLQLKNVWDDELFEPYRIAALLELENFDSIDE